MRCPKCGNQTVPERFCEYCGEPFYQADAQSERRLACTCGADSRPGAIYCHMCGGRTEEGDVKWEENKKAKPRWKKILGWVLFVWGILGVATEVVFLIFFGFDGISQLIRLVMSGLFIWGGYTLKK